MSKTRKPKQKYIYFFVFFIFFIITSVFIYSKYQTNILNSLGEVFFLRLHKNNYAINILEFNKNKNDTTFFLLGRIYFVKGDLPKSVQQYDKAIEINPNVKEYYYGRALAYSFASKELLPFASKDFEKYLTMDEEDFKKTGMHAYGAWAGYNDLAWTYYLQKDFKKAEETVKNGLKISGSNAWLLNMYGAILIEQDKCKEALPKLKEAKKLINKTSVEKYGEAYSGDDSKIWSKGKESMEAVINENINYCQKTFPQTTN